MVIEILKWVTVFMALFGAYEGSKPNGSKLKMNLLFTFTNTFNIIYFGFSFEWAYLFRNLMFWIITLIGIKRNWRKTE